MPFIINRKKPFNYPYVYVDMDEFARPIEAKIQNNYYDVYRYENNYTGKFKFTLSDGSKFDIELKNYDQTIKLYESLNYNRRYKVRIIIEEDI